MRSECSLYFRLLVNYRDLLQRCHAGFVHLFGTFLLSFILAQHIKDTLFKNEYLMLSNWTILLPFNLLPRRIHTVVPEYMRPCQQEPVDVCQGK